MNERSFDPYPGPRRHRRTDVDLRSVFRKDGRLYTVVSIADEPTVEICDALTGKVENHVISSWNLAEFEHLRPVVPSERMSIDARVQAKPGALPDSTGG